MKKKYLIISIFALIIAFISIWASISKGNIMQTAKADEPQTHSQSKKILIAYFSHSGNTRVIAEYIKNVTDADLFEIKPVNDYPEDYKTVVNQAKKEINSNYKPELKTKIKDIDSYDVIFIGSPNWWSTIAPPVSTFLTSYNFSGKTIVPFITHGGGGFGHCDTDIKKLCPKSVIPEGIAIYENDIRNSQKEISEWLKKINITK